MDVHFGNHLDHTPHDTTPGLRSEMLEVTREAFCAGNYKLAVEIYSSQLADPRHLDRGLCLLNADALSGAGRIAEALDFYCTAAKLDRLRVNELGTLVDCIAHTLRIKERIDSKGVSEDEPSLDLFSCQLCKCLFYKPVTLECGHTFCQRCLENNSIKDCYLCRYKLSKTWGAEKPIDFRVNVVLNGLLHKWFCAESEARRCWLEGERMHNERDFINALEKYNKAVEIAPFVSKLLGRRAELHIAMNNFRQAVDDGDTMCQLTPHYPKAHYVKALALSKAGQKEEALKEYLYCVALRPDWIAAKQEAQTLLSEMFSSVFKMDSFQSLMVPHHAGPSTRLKSPSFLLGCLHSTPGRQSQPPNSCKDVLSNPGAETTSPCEKSKTLASVQAVLPGASSLKRKLLDQPQGTTPHNKQLRKDDASSCQKPAACCAGRRVPPQLLDKSDLECSLCMRLFYEPVTTPCGHTFCLKCLERCLDHNPHCPLCKENIAQYLTNRGYHRTLLIEKVLQRYLSEELSERRKVHQEEITELSNLTKEVPIFICTMAFPTITCPLHIFEPCYRLMIRRSMETGTKQFGMCIADNEKGFADYGCMLELKEVKFYPDGGLVVSTVGLSRFKVVSHGHRDGYNTAQIEHLEDQTVEGEGLVALLKLHDSVYSQASAWFSSLKDSMKNQIVSHFGQLPGKDPDMQGSPSGPAWCWWLLAVLPLEQRAQLTILAMTTLRDRLSAIRRVLILVTRKRQPPG
ncbi:hypothetical protein UPYG_G00020520 [Umbra pygmaea]|uniref:Uncharacterized protein n=1 Tax=Umbra pygmaea TaxID=75934 RepID=A0ABD0XKN0_UMBPY